ncbi:hypothetical protein FRB98_004711 [Tulasnella sp. 332]|nr:hypothetical protein FRB98_004711 [Tulasnella sp. 332]
MISQLRLSAILGKRPGRLAKVGRTALWQIRYRWNEAESVDDEDGRGMPPPLKGIRVVDLTRVLAGPTSTMLLADLGADVIKIEEVSRGDDTRSWIPPHAPISEAVPPSTLHLPPESAYFMAVNRNKRSITVNLKKPEGLEIVRDLIRKADVLVENFVPGKLEEMGLGWVDCEAGLMHITGEPDRPPCKVGVAVTDISTGLYAHGSILAALLSRQQTGKGVWIDCNLFETQIAGLANIASNYLIAGVEASRHGTAHPSIVPYQVFPCKNGFLMIGAGNDKQFAIFASKVLNRPDLVNDARFATNTSRVAHRKVLVETITDLLMEHDREFWLEKFQGQGVPFGPINNLQQTFEHPQAVARGITKEIDHPRSGKIKLVAPAVSYNGKRMPIERPPPWLSQHTDEVLRDDLGYSKERINQLREAKVI